MTNTNTYPPPGGALQDQMLPPTVPAQSDTWAAPAVPPTPPRNRARQPQPGEAAVRVYVPAAPTHPVPVQPARPAGNGLAVAGMVLGIMSLVLDATVIGCALGVPVAIVGFVLSVFGARRPGRGIAIAGIVCSVLGVVVPALLLAVLSAVIRG